jgi:hypothetical protein
MERNHLDDQAYIADLASRFRELTRDPEQPAGQPIENQDFAVASTNSDANGNSSRKRRVHRLEQQGGIPKRRGVHLWE